MDIPDGVIGNSRTPVSAGSSQPASGQSCSTGDRALLISRFHTFRAPASAVAVRCTGRPEEGHPQLVDPF
ncbi:hypothetical protein [Streptomyces sp. NPDC001194]|uniref:hypothetical protein n=1 Tax=Streptomyces sp. NPDC001194 TaxID=3364547 RepID=UPI0036CA58BB